jgi:uncharacterized damage-inducible protein DinB
MEPKNIDKPIQGYPGFFDQYLKNVPDDGALLQHLNNILTETETLVSNLTEEQLMFRYQEDKWTIKDILLHLVDCERIIIYRATRIARADKTILPGFDENLFVLHANANNRTVTDILKELKAFRASSIVFIETLDEESLDRTGTANGLDMSTRLLVNHLYGHHKHHLNIIRERYLPAC